VGALRHEVRDHDISTRRYDTGRHQGPAATTIDQLKPTA